MVGLCPVLGDTNLFIPLFHREQRAIWEITRLGQDLVIEHENSAWLWQGWSSKLQLGVCGIQLRFFPSKCEV
jgi:hypothetical protein